MLKRILFLVVVQLLISYGGASLQAQQTVEQNQWRGIVVYPSDLISLGADWWVQVVSEANLNLIGIHTDSKFETLPKLKSYLESKDGKRLLKHCKKNDIAVEFELHVLQDVLPRSEFDAHPDYFRMNADGKRQRSHNMCFSSEGAYNEIEKSIREICTWMKPTTHRYYFWTDDYTNAFCHCQQCSNYSASEQALLYENRLLEMIKKVDSKATLAHLAYHNTLSAPVKVKPAKGIFLEYAPIGRNYAEALSEEHLSSLEDNLNVFPKETAHILEYWLDVSFFSKWQKDELMALPWEKEDCKRDVIQYTDFGAKSITTFAAWINSDYIKKFGEAKTRETIIEYGEILNKYIK